MAPLFLGFGVFGWGTFRVSSTERQSSLGRKDSMKRLIPVVAILLIIAVSASAATFTVDSTLDAVDVHPGDGLCQTGAGPCTLRAAIMEANALAGADVASLPSGTYALTIPSADPWDVDA